MRYENQARANEIEFSNVIHTEIGRERENAMK